MRIPDNSIFLVVGLDQHGIYRIVIYVINYYSTRKFAMKKRMVAFYAHISQCMNRAHLLHHGFPAQRDNNVENSWNHQRTIIYIQNRLSFCLIGSVNDLDTIACPSVSALGAIVMEFGMDIIVIPMQLFPSYLFWWLMWRVTTDVAVSVCGRSGLWPFWFVAVPVCGRFGLWPFRSVALPVCGRFGLWPFRFVAISVCGRLGCGRFGLWPLWPVTNSSTPPGSATIMSRVDGVHLALI